MKILNDFMDGLRAFTKAFGFIRKNGLSHYYLYPLLIIIILYVIGFQLIEQVVDLVTSGAYDWLNVEQGVVADGRFSFLWDAWETMKGWYNSSSAIVLSLLIKVVMFILLLMVNKYVMLALLSPALALISERTEELITGKEYPFDWKQFLKDVLRGVWIAIRNLFMELFMLGLLWIATLFIALVAPVSVVISVLISSYFYGFSMIDYISERKRLDLRDGYRLVRRRKGIAIALGLTMMLLMKIPLIGFTFAAFASIIGAVAAVIVFEENGEYKSLEPSSEKLIP